VRYKLSMRNAVVAAGVVLLLFVQAVPFSTAASSTIPGQAVGLVLTITPPKLPACVPSIRCTDPAVIVSLVDANSLPSAATSAITVYLTSSLPNIAYFPSAFPYQVMIQPGKTYVVVNVTTTATPGTTEITASSSGLASASADLTTVEPSGFPDKLSVFASPDEFQGTSVQQGIVKVELVDDAGLPSKAIVQVNVSLTSSNPSLASLAQNNLTIPAGSLYASGAFESGIGKGTAVITASSTGFQSGDSIVTLVTDSCTGPCVPVGLNLRVLSGSGSVGNLPADGQDYDVLEVSLLDSQGGPATATSNVAVQLSTSKSEVVNLVNDIVTISSGQESVIAVLSTSALEGTATITATSTGLLPQTVDVSTFIPAPSKLGLYVAPPSISAYPGQFPPILVVQLQDSAGNPARARQSTSIIVSPSNSSMVSNPLYLTVSIGSDCVYTTVTAAGTGVSALTASTQGLSSAQASLQLAPSPLVIHHSSPSYIFENQTAVMFVSVSFLGDPLVGVNVTWGAAHGEMSPGSTKTGLSGTTSSTFIPASVGAENITAMLSAPVIGITSVTYYLNVVPVPVKPPRTFMQELMSFWYYIAAAVVAVIAAAFYMLRMRRKKQKAEIEAGFEVV
jgi:hypothetical protein